MASTAKLIIDAFMPLIGIRQSTVLKIGKQIPIPDLSADILSSLCDEALQAFSSNKSLIRLESPIYIIGDIHGNLHDLLRIFAKIDKPFSNHYLFLGDYVDRGSYSIEVIAILLSLSIVHPDSFFLLRGNHEFSCVNGQYGFKDDIISRFHSDELWIKFDKVFQWLPLTCIIDGTVFCVHGGLSPHLNSILDVENLPIPLENYDNPLIADLMWSDPSKQVSSFMDSLRGTGVMFGKNAIVSFLKKTTMQMIVRGHECVIKGVQTSFKGTLVTVFSSSFYSEDENSAGFVQLMPERKLITTSLVAVRHIKRDKAAFSDGLYTDLSFINEDGLKSESMNACSPALTNSMKLQLLSFKQNSNYHRPALGLFIKAVPKKSSSFSSELKPSVLPDLTRSESKLPNIHKSDDDD